MLLYFSGIALERSSVQFGFLKKNYLVRPWIPLISHQQYYESIWTKFSDETNIPELLLSSEFWKQIPIKRVEEAGST